MISLKDYTQKILVISNQICDVNYFVTIIKNGISDNVEGKITGLSNILFEKTLEKIIIQNFLFFNVGADVQITLRKIGNDNINYDFFSILLKTNEVLIFENNNIFAYTSDGILKSSQSSGQSGNSNSLFTPSLKLIYDSTATWIQTNGQNVLNHLNNFNNPHNITLTQLNAYSKQESLALLESNTDFVQLYTSYKT